MTLLWPKLKRALQFSWYLAQSKKYHIYPHSPHCQLIVPCARVLRSLRTGDLLLRARDVQHRRGVPWRKLQKSQVHRIYGRRLRHRSWKVRLWCVTTKTIRFLWLRTSHKYLSFSSTHLTWASLQTCFAFHHHTLCSKQHETTLQEFLHLET